MKVRGRCLNDVEYLNNEINHLEGKVRDLEMLSMKQDSIINRLRDIYFELHFNFGNPPSKDKANELLKEASGLLFNS